MFCKNCGKELDDKAVVCIQCGCLTDEGEFLRRNEHDNTQIKKEDNILGVIAKVFMIIGCVVTGFYLIPLCWTIPMTVKLSNALDEDKEISVGFKVCVLIFCNLIAGILLLCMKSKSRKIAN